MTVIHQLLEKYRLGTISTDELRQLQTLVEENVGEKEILEDILSTLHQGAPDSGWHSAEHAHLVEQIVMDTPVMPIRSNSRKWWLAAACVAAIFSTGIYWYQHRIITPTPYPVHLAMMPGGNKAMLVLADGSTVPLDSANLGQIARQGDANINNNGESLIYDNQGPSTKVVYNSIVTPRGGQYQLGLPDGSRVWLNAASSIRFPTAFPGKERRVEITGEAYFQIAADPNKPFLVDIKGNDSMQVQVLGTSFNVMAYTDEQEIATTLENGAVKLLHGSAQTVLQPGYTGTLTHHAGFATAQADLEQTLAWKEGKFRFRNTNIQTIMRQISRWYDVDISYEGDLSDVDLTGIISRRENAASLLKILSATQRVQFETTNNKIRVKPYNPEQ
ncbi:FecR protein [Chitinophaga dinghuensis]|uniref:FecR protein n=1 Tax=Chitinophaga dinghuensis TaxID=1539050 RepID=A0A327VTR2_9BACT|nr:FecR family protein [Chitinophaga dinghuensis]RAJ77460.1 FecR protein [Chitinophaga dinghuensis]